MCLVIPLDLEAYLPHCLEALPSLLLPVLFHAPSPTAPLRVHGHGPTQERALRFRRTRVLARCMAALRERTAHWRAKHLLWERAVGHHSRVTKAAMLRSGEGASYPAVVPPPHPAFSLLSSPPPRLSAQAWVTRFTSHVRVAHAPSPPPLSPHSSSPSSRPLLLAQRMGRGDSPTPPACAAVAGAGRGTLLYRRRHGVRLQRLPRHLPRPVHGVVAQRRIDRRRRRVGSPHPDTACAHHERRRSTRGRRKVGARAQTPSPRYPSRPPLPRRPRRRGGRSPRYTTSPALFICRAEPQRVQPQKTMMRVMEISVARSSSRLCVQSFSPLHTRSSAAARPSRALTVIAAHRRLVAEGTAWAHGIPFTATPAPSPPAARALPTPGPPPPPLALPTPFRSAEKMAGRRALHNRGSRWAR